MPSQAEKWEESQEVVTSVSPKVEIDATPLGGEGEDVVVDLNAERQKRSEAAISREKARIDIEELKALQEARKNVASLGVEEPIKHRKQWMEDAPSNPMKEPAGKMRSKSWAENESRGFFAKLFNRKLK